LLRASYSHLGKFFRGAEIFSMAPGILSPTFAFRPENRETQSPELTSERNAMKTTLPLTPRVRRLILPALIFLAALPVDAQNAADPWDNAVTVLKTAFTGTIATCLSLLS